MAATLAEGAKEAEDVVLVARAVKRGGVLDLVLVPPPECERPLCVLCPRGLNGGREC